MSDRAKPSGGSIPLTYVGPKGRISLGINEDGLVDDALGMRQVEEGRVSSAEDVIRRLREGQEDR